MMMPLNLRVGTNSAIEPGDVIAGTNRPNFRMNPFVRGFQTLEFTDFCEAFACIGAIIRDVLVYGRILNGNQRFHTDNLERPLCLPGLPPGTFGPAADCLRGHVRRTAHPRAEHAGLGRRRVPPPPVRSGVSSAHRDVGWAGGAASEPLSSACPAQDWTWG